MPSVKWANNPAGTAATDWSRVWCTSHAHDGDVGCVDDHPCSDSVQNSAWHWTNCPEQSLSCEKWGWEVYPGGEPPWPQIILYINLSSASGSPWSTRYILGLEVLAPRVHGTPEYMVPCLFTYPCHKVPFVEVSWRALFFWVYLMHLMFSTHSSGS